MKVSDFLSIYKQDSFVKTLAESFKAKGGGAFQVKGLVGSLDAVVPAAVFSMDRQCHVFVMHEKEEAAYFFNDMQNLFGEREVLFFPTSYKRPYQFDETENANILLRADVLNKLNHRSGKGEIIVTYPEALTEKVINKRALTENTFNAKVGDKVDVEFIAELLMTYDFERTDFVYEAGQYAVRGGIIDIYSYAGELPYRMELFGDEIESIRTFDPNTQLSQDSVNSISIIPNVQTRLLQEKRQSFLEFVPKETRFWIKDLQLLYDQLDSYFTKASASFDVLMKESGNTKIVLEPADLFENAATIKSHIFSFPMIEFGSRFYLENATTFQYEAEPQPPFHKNFEMMVENLNQRQLQGYNLFIAAESEKQIERLDTIFQELDPTMRFEGFLAGLREGFVDKQIKLLCYTDHQLFDRFHKYKTREKHTKSKALTIKELKSLQPGDYVVHIDYGVGRFAGLDAVDVGGKKQEALRIVYRDNDLLYVSVHSLHKISRYAGKEGQPPPINKLGTQDWDIKKKKVKKRVKDIAKDLISLYAKRKATPGYAFPPDNFLQAELESSFIYQDTPDQALATADVKKDMEQPHPMDRLVCGDVGFGKTEVAIRAAFKTASNGKQVAVLVPTTILAMQHYRTFKERLANFPLDIEYINRFRTTKEIKDILQRVKEGKIDILIGTHRIVNKDVEFKDLGLLVIDEEQKFGVKIKEKLKESKVNVDSLTLTATPIPRTLHFSMMGARDLSIIATPPPNRQPVTTELHEFNESVIRDAISFELRRGGQVFFVHNRVSDIDQIASIVLRLVPDARIGIAHGQMDGPKLEKVMMRFIEGEFDVLVSTNIIESGLDIPNANTIIINRAHMFGLSDLHQMRGRVGRSNKKAFCLLLSGASSGLTAEARKRLVTLEEFSELGDGFKVAMRDLDIRGAGDLLGGEQSGFISDLGFEMYHKILDETIQELKIEDYSDLFAEDIKKAVEAVATDCVIETDLEILIPESYVNNISERLSLYSHLDSIEAEEELAKFSADVKDRFGPIPEEVEELIKTVRLRWLAKKAGIEKLILKVEVLKCYFVSGENEAYFKSPTFGKVLEYVQKNPKISRMREHKGRLILNLEQVKSVDHAIGYLKKMLQENEASVAQ
ncbi:transcription-repair coupling factor [uncultured Imperialibacter sp.]|uniref:transcription-repair coupling factor n=1 Tax=uncultured Imperialibacter sp. TaxID=1672639 RepID=UPI0030D7A2E9